MNTFAGLLPLLVLPVVLLGTSVPAIERGTSPAGVDYVSGGAGAEERLALGEQRGRYSFWLTTAQLKNGAYLSNIRVRIRDEEQHLVLDHVTDGPWLMAQLPPGRYEVEAILQSEKPARIEIQRGQTQIHPGDRHRMVLYFAGLDAPPAD